MTSLPTHAIVVRVTFKAGLEESASTTLESQVVPGAKAAPGFVAGYWMHSADHHNGTSVELFDTWEDAKAALKQRSMEMPPESPVTIDSAEILEIVARA